MIAGRAAVFIGKNGQNSVADELVYVTAILEHDRHHGPHVLVQEIDDHGGIFLLAECSESADVREQDCDILARPGEGDVFRLV